MTEKSLHVVDPQGRHIVLDIQQYHRHIQAEHAEMDNVECILDAVANPSSIWRETRYPNSQVYYKRGAHPAYPDLYVRVVVRSGYVVTAHLIDKPRGRSHRLIWTPES